MPGEYLPILIILAMATALGFIAVGLGHLLGPRRPTTRKGEPYESGMRPYGRGARRVPIHFYLMAVMFILFDIEIVFLLPWAVTLRSLGTFGLVAMAVFIGVLMVGYVYMWKKGAMEWE